VQYSTCSSYSLQLLAPRGQQQAACVRRAYRDVDSGPHKEAQKVEEAETEEE
jgi:hypothetical protein